MKLFRTDRLLEKFKLFNKSVNKDNIKKLMHFFKNEFVLKNQYDLIFSYLTLKIIKKIDIMVELFNLFSYLKHLKLCNKKCY